MYCSKCSLRNPIQSLILWNAIFNDIQILCLGFLCLKSRCYFVYDIFAIDTCLWGHVYTIPDSLSCRHENYSGLVWTETAQNGAQNWNKFVQTVQQIVPKRLTEEGLVLKILVVYHHLHGQTGRFTVWAKGKQISVLGNSVRDWRLPFAEIPTIYIQNNLHNGDG